MSKFLVQKTVYISIEVKGDTWEDAMQTANDIHYAAWKYDDEETPTVTQINKVEQTA